MKNQNRGKSQKKREKSMRYWERQREREREDEKRGGGRGRRERQSKCRYFAEKGSCRQVRVIRVGMLQEFVLPGLASSLVESEVN